MVSQIFPVFCKNEMKNLQHLGIPVSIIMINRDRFHETRHEIHTGHEKFRNCTPVYMRPDIKTEKHVPFSDVLAFIFANENKSDLVFNSP